MLTKITIDSSGVPIDDDLMRYIKKKIGKLDRFTPLSVRRTINADVKLSSTSHNDRRRSTCEVVLHTPNEVMVSSETTINMFAAIDIVEASLRRQLRHSASSRQFNRTKIRKLLSRSVSSR